MYSVYPWISCATLYLVMAHGQSARFYCSRAEVELMILVKPRKRKSGNKVFSRLKAPQKHCTDLNIKTSTSSKRTTALRQPSGFQLASNVIYSTKWGGGGGTGGSEPPASRPFFRVSPVPE